MWSEYTRITVIPKRAVIRLIWNSYCFYLILPYLCEFREFIFFVKTRFLLIKHDNKGKYCNNSKRFI